MEPTAEQRAEWDAWVRERPPAVQAVAAKFPPWVCLRDATGRGHYVVTSYEEPKVGPITLKVAHGRDSFAPGFEVFGVKPDDMRPCGCGEWAWPTEEQADATMSEVEVFKAKVDAAGLRIRPGLRLEPK